MRAEPKSPAESPVTVIERDTSEFLHCRVTAGAPWGRPAPAWMRFGLARRHKASGPSSKRSAADNSIELLTYLCDAFRLPAEGPAYVHLQAPRPFRRRCNLPKPPSFWPVLPDIWRGHRPPATCLSVCGQAGGPQFHAGTQASL